MDQNISAFAAYKQIARQNQVSKAKHRRNSSRNKLKKAVSTIENSVQSKKGNLTKNPVENGLSNSEQLLTKVLVQFPQSNVSVKKNQLGEKLVSKISKSAVSNKHQKKYKGNQESKKTLIPFHVQPNNIFKWMIAPLTASDFLDNVWEKSPVFLKRDNKEYYKHILTTTDLDTILRSNPLHYNRNVDVVSYVDGKRETHNLEGRALPAVLWDYYSNGCSIRILNPQTYSNKLYMLLATLQEYFGCMVGANLYLTPPDSQGFAPHYDDIEAFVLQLEGRKHWKLYSPRVQNEVLPRFSSKNFNRKELGTPIKEVTLEAGDLLYFPRGVIHEGRTDPDSHSLHVTISVYQKVAYVDLLEHTVTQALKVAAEKKLEYREGLPIGYLKHLGVANASESNETRTNILKKLRKLFANLVDYAPFDMAADQLGKQFIWDSLPPFLSKEEKSHSVRDDGERMQEGKVFNRGEMSLDTKIRLTRYYCVRLAIEEDAVKLFYNTENARVYHGEELQFVEINSTAIPAIQFLLKSYPNYVEVETLPMEKDSDKMQLAGDLWERSILITEEPLEKPDY